MEKNQYIVLITVFIGVLIGIALFSASADQVKLDVTEYTSGLIENETMLGSLDAPLDLGIQTFCGATWVVNGSVDRWDSDPVSFVFNARDDVLNLDVCSLWGNWSGSWSENESMISLGEFNPVLQFNITLPISNQAYLWGVHCNNTANVGSDSANQTFLITQGVLA